MRPAAHSSKRFKSAPLVTTNIESVAEDQVQLREEWTEGIRGKIQPAIKEQYRPINDRR